MRKHQVLYLAVMLMLLVGMMVAPVAAVTGPQGEISNVPGQSSTYIIQLEGAALASYQGGVPGLEATNPRVRGEANLDVNSPASAAYLDYLAAEQAQFISGMELALGRAVDVPYQYLYVYNGLAARLTPQEAAVVAALPGVVNVQPEVVRYPTTDVSPEWLGAVAIWDGSATGGLPGTMGEGVIVGVIDTGINFDHSSFADIGGDGYDHTNPFGAGNYAGWCDPANPNYDPSVHLCNDKLIGAWDYTNDGNKGEDDDGHGSHTASTAAGNVVTSTLVAPTAALTRTISGMAPHANIIAYDTCISGAGCPGAGLIAAINQAVADGVDVINYSIGGGSSNPWTDGDSLAFLDAREAGVFVATSAGNNGPGAGSMGSPANSPWLTAAGSATHNRLIGNDLIDMAGGSAPADMAGVGFTSGYGPAEIVHARYYTSTGGPNDALCLASFPAGTFNGEIVVCDRGINARVDKGANVLAGGAGGYVLANDEANGEAIVADMHYLPAVHVGYADAEILRNWLTDTTVQTATISGYYLDLDPSNGDILAASSSRGPNLPVPDVIKPDIAAPGVSVWAASMNGTEYEFMSGTSMASPHIAGSGALLRALHPGWSVAEIQSALMMTSLGDVVRKQDTVTPADPFDQGAGRVDLYHAAMVGFVLDETRANYDAANPALGGDPASLNLASLGNGDCYHECSWIRTLSSTLDTLESWTVAVTGTPGLVLTVEPSSFDLAPYAAQVVTITADTTGLTVGDWAFGRVSFVPSTTAIPEAHFPLAVLPAGDPPSITVEPTSFEPVLPAWSLLTEPLTITNNGETPLEWEVYEDSGAGLLGGGINQGNWFDSFDTYTTGSQMHGQGGWKGWGDDVAYGAIVTDAYANSAPNSVEIVGNSDLVHEYTHDTGFWYYTAWQYIPGDFDGESYFLLLNQYDDAGTTNNWSTQVHFNSATDQVIADGIGSTFPPLPIIYDQWVEIRVEIDLDGDYQEFYYDDQLLFEGSWSEGMSGAGITSIGAVDLYANGASAVYYDDLSLVQQVPDWCDNFDSYPTDTQLQDVGGWKGWGNDPAAAGWTRDEYARSTPNSIEIVNLTDAVHEYTDHTSGIWYFTAWQYIPTGSTGESYFILLNQYDDAGTTNNWSTQVNFNSDLNLVVAEGEAAGAQLPLVRDQWMEILVEIDLFNDIQKFYYGGDLLYESSWTDGMSGGGILNIAAVDLWGNSASAVYYDDICLTSALPEICDQISDIPWVSVAPASGVTHMGESSVAGVTFDTAGMAVGVYGANLCVGSNDPVNPLIIVPLTMTVQPCSELTDVTINGPSDLLVNQVGTYTLTWEPITATEPLQVEWDNGMTGTTATYSWPAAGIYTIMVTATNCDGTNVVTDAFEVTVTCNELLSAAISGPSELAVGEMGTFTVTWEPADATPPIEIAWDNGMTGVTAAYSWPADGTYTIMVTLTNCAGAGAVTATFEVTVLPCVELLTATISGPDHLMVDEPGTFTVTWEPADATPPIMIEWSNGITGTTAVFAWTVPGTYTVVVTATNCMDVVVVGEMDVFVEEAQLFYYVYLPLVFNGYTGAK